jgi:hypothetical protein
MSNKCKCTKEITFSGKEVEFALAVVGVLYKYFEDNPKEKITKDNFEEICSGVVHQVKGKESVIEQNYIG